MPPKNSRSRRAASEGDLSTELGAVATWVASVCCYWYEPGAGRVPQGPPGVSSAARPERRATLWLTNPRQRPRLLFPLETSKDQFFRAADAQTPAALPKKTAGCRRFGFSAPSLTAGP